MIVALIAIYRALFRDLPGYWPIVWLVGLAILYAVVTPMIERRLFAPR